MCDSTPSTHSQGISLTVPDPDDQSDNKPVLPIRRKVLQRSERQNHRVTFSVPQSTVSKPSLNFPTLTDPNAKQLERATIAGQSAVSQCLVRLSDMTVAGVLSLCGMFRKNGEAS